MSYRRIRALPSSMMTMLDEVLRQCGFIGTLIIGGPDPELADSITSMIFHTGKTATGQSFIESYPDLKESVTNAFNSTFKVVDKYNPFDDSGRVVSPSPVGPSHSGESPLPPAPPPPMTVTDEPLRSAPRNSDETTDGDVDMQDPEDEPRIVGGSANASADLSAGSSEALGDAAVNPGDTQTAEPPLAQAPEVILQPIKYINGMSQYEWDKLQNIDRNKKLIEALGMKGAVEGVFGKKAGKGKENEPTSRKKVSRKRTSKVEKRVTRLGAKATMDMYVSLAPYI